MKLFFNELQFQKLCLNLIIIEKKKHFFIWWRDNRVVKSVSLPLCSFCVMSSTPVTIGIDLDAELICTIKYITPCLSLVVSKQDNLSINCQLPARADDIKKFIRSPMQSISKVPWRPSNPRFNWEKITLKGDFTFYFIT